MFNSDGEIYAGVIRKQQTAISLKTWVVGWEHMPDEQFKLAKKLDNLTLSGKGFLNSSCKSRTTTTLKLNVLTLKEQMTPPRTLRILKSRLLFGEKLLIDSLC